MSVDRPGSDLPDWRGPRTCPFCGAGLADGGPAFVDHLGSNPGCRSGFELWRDRAAGDVRGEWAG